MADMRGRNCVCGKARGNDLVSQRNEAQHHTASDQDSELARGGGELADLRSGICPLTIRRRTCALETRRTS